MRCLVGGGCNCVGASCLFFGKYPMAGIGGVAIHGNMGGGFSSRVFTLRGRNEGEY